jgi:hypothetical protein
MAIENTESFVILKHPSGASVKILKYGATVIEWTLGNGTRNLFLSEFVFLLTPLTEVLENWTDQKLYVAEYLLYPPP